MTSFDPLDRRSFMRYCAALGVNGTLFPGALYALADDEDEPITIETIARAEKIAGLSFTNEERKMMVEDLNNRLDDYSALRAEEIGNETLPAFTFDPAIGGTVPPPVNDTSSVEWEPPSAERPGDDESLAFLPVTHLASLLKSGQITSTELTELYLARLKKYDPLLTAVVTLTEDRAREQARQADEELSNGRWRGPLHGIPWGAKDLLAVPEYPTTWGGAPYRNQVIDETAAVVERLDGAGAILVAKLSLGALAMGDEWFEGQTKSPWNLEKGSSGSSAGPGAAVSAGLVGFAIGSETYGSIVSPATRNGITGFRPTFGRVSRYGAMALSWTMDKLGPMTRSAEDSALVFDAIRGKDTRDPTTVDAPFRWSGEEKIHSLRVGYVEDVFEHTYDNRSADRKTLEVLREMNIELTPITLPSYPLNSIRLTLEVEAAAAFDELTRSNRDDMLVQQDENDWPNIFRRSRFVPAVEFIQANRVRTRLMNAMNDVMTDVDVFVAPTFEGDTLLLTNLTGHPAAAVPNAFHQIEEEPQSPRRNPGSITFIGGLYKDDAVLKLAHAYQQNTTFHMRRPPLE